MIWRLHCWIDVSIPDTVYGLWHMTYDIHHIAHGGLYVVNTYRGYSMSYNLDTYGAMYGMWYVYRYDTGHGMYCMLWLVVHIIHYLHVAHSQENKSWEVALHVTQCASKSTVFMFPLPYHQLYVQTVLESSLNNASMKGWNGLKTVSFL